MKYFETKIGQIINKEFDSRMELCVFSYILEKGTSNISSITEDEISKIEGNGLMTTEFCQSLVRCAVKICKECEHIKIMEYIRLHLNFQPNVKEVWIYREDYENYSDFLEILKQLDLEEEDVGDSFSIYAIVNEDTLPGN